ncbi:heme-binding protein [Novosphingobium tardum]|uniref:Heme-binding protein n=1 Tax=Novosphingobium tardum TaxID=1538021 RepID=A0ABV8RR43_9SPHN
MNAKVAFRQSTAFVAALSLALAGCGGGGGSGNSVGSPAPTPTPSASPTGGLFVAPAQEALSVADVQKVIAQAVGEAQARNLPSIIAVVDRVGNVLAVFRMNGAKATMLTSSYISKTGTFNNPPIDAQGLEVQATMGAISKAITGAYLSSGGNAFSSRTASQIVQQHFPPAPITPGLESGPLFGVQFSQLPCSDLSARYLSGGGAAALIGPKRAPLGLAADPGGFPLYKNGVIVGGVGVMGDGDYAFDPNILDTDNDAEEFIALAGIQGFAPPEEILADRITVDGTSLRFSDARIGGLSALKSDFAAANGTAGTLIPVNGYTAGAILAGTPYGTEASGIRASTPAEFSNRDAFILTDGAGHNRFPIRGGTDGGAIAAAPLSATEVRAVLEEAFTIMSRARAQIRRPLDSRAQVSISVVDTYGAPLGLVRGPDAPIFGTDVSLQKARTAAFFSGKAAAQQLTDDPDGEVAEFVQRVRTFLGDPNALTGTKAFADRSGGNLSRPYFPDGEVGRPNGPLSRPIDDFNPFATGLQIALVKSNLLQHALFVQGVGFGDTAAQCTNVPATPTGQKRLANGIQIFPGSVPIYRGDVLVGAIGVSGDGIDQDDMISFLGTNNGGARVGSIGNAPKAIRADTIVVNVGDGVRLRYVNCPFAPFLDTSTQNACEGL